MIEKNTYCVIFAGGKGRRLWPCSREVFPKQFIDFFGTGRTQLQQTYDRFRKLLPSDHIYINTGERYIDIVHEQLPDVADENILAEPVHRNTAPGAMWAAWRISRINPDANVIVTPSDQTVQDEEAFLDYMRRGVEFVEEKNVQLVMGVKPTRPEPGYGYLQMGEMVEKDVYKVQTFAEKPEREFARMFLERRVSVEHRTIHLRRPAAAGHVRSACPGSDKRAQGSRKDVFTGGRESVYKRELPPPA